ncbi:MAG: NYN domain-containing protein [Coriobacteriia bacterium]
MPELAFVVDGFNLYHSVRDLERSTGLNCRWLDVRSLCDSFMSAIGNNTTIGDVYYLSALAYHREQRKPGTVARHQAFINALISTGVKIELAQFKPKDIAYTCSQCAYRGKQRRYEEKETDVAIAIKIMTLAVSPDVEGIAIVSGDTDLLPAIREAKRLSAKPIYMLFPYKRHSGSLEKLATTTFNLGYKHYSTHQFPDPVVSPTGLISCPAK